VDEWLAVLKLGLYDASSDEGRLFSNISQISSLSELTQ
jgi:hypothetical protein